MGKGVGGIVEGLSEWVERMGSGNGVVVGGMVGGMMCSEMGGGVNKGG